MAIQNRDGRQTLKTPATLEDIAQAAGVTATTVARAIKGNGYVASATREKVLRITRELNYTPNPAARTLATGRTGVIAVISAQLDQPYYANFVHLMESQIISSGYQMRLLHSRTELKEVIKATKSSSADGIIVNGMHDLSEESEFFNTQLFQNCVFVDTYEHKHTDYVRIDLRSAVEEALERMIAVGRTRIAYVGISDDLHFDPTIAEGDRLITYLSVMERADRKPEYINARYDLSRSERIQALREYFEIHGCPGGLICLHDEIAIVVCRALNDCGYRIPDDVLVVGCDGIFFMECFNPPLSSIVQPMQEVCDLAWQFLLARIANPGTPLQQATLKAQLAVRKSLQP